MEYLEMQILLNKTLRFEQKLSIVQLNNPVPKQMSTTILIRITKATATSTKTGHTAYNILTNCTN